MHADREATLRHRTGLPDAATSRALLDGLHHTLWS
jgi:hypothetical protein